MQVTGSNAGSIHVCNDCRDVVIKPCDYYAEGHQWECFDHYGCPTGEQSCMCGALRHHPNDTHTAGHFAGHRAHLEDGGECWCTTTGPHGEAAGGANHD